MTPRQRRALVELKRALKAMSHYHGREAHELEANPLFPQVQRRHDRAIGAAIRAGLMDYPLVQPWLIAHRRLGQRDLLRRLKKGLETGVRRPLTLAQVLLEVEALPLIEAGYKPERTRELVTARMLALAANNSLEALWRQEARRLHGRMKGMKRQTWHEQYKLLKALLEA